MSFGDLKTEEGVQRLDAHLADRSYIEGYQTSQADTAVFSALSKIPSDQFPHALRWYNHIKSYGDEKSRFPGEKKEINAYGSGSVAQNNVEDDADDDDIDLFGSDDEEEDLEAEKLRQKRLEDYEAKKAKKSPLIAKSNIILEVKPWDDETDMAELEKCVRTVEVDGLRWAASKLVPVGYGINKLQISCIVEDDKVGTDFLEEEIVKFEDYVQSVDIVAFQKI